MLKGLKRKRLEEQLQLEREHNAIFSFKNAMSFASDLNKYSQYSKQDILDIIDYMLEAVKVDLQTSLQTEFLFNKYAVKEISYPFPRVYFDKFDVKHSLDVSDDNKHEVWLSKSCIIALPWKQESYYNQAINLKYNDFEYYSSSHECCYFPYVDICYVLNANHSISSASAYKKGSLMEYCYDIVPLFENVCTDGLKWYSSHTRIEMGSVWDFRTAVIFELAKMKYKLEHEQ